MLFTLNLYSVLLQLYLNKNGGEKSKQFLIIWKSVKEVSYLGIVKLYLKHVNITLYYTFNMMFDIHVHVCKAIKNVVSSQEPTTKPKKEH